MPLAKIIKSPLSHRTSVHYFADLETAPFDVADYSRMKFGSALVAKRFGEEMANHFFHHNYTDLVSNQCVVIPAPSTTVPVAATLLSHHFMNCINKLLAEGGHQPVEWSMVHRNMTYNNNYADLPKEERKKLLEVDSIYFNRDFVAGKFLIFVDDCSITGTHEDKISSYLSNAGMDNDHSFVCFAQYTGGDPSIEMRLNHTEIKDAHDLVELSHQKDHRVTTRSLRLLLEHSEKDFEKLLKSASNRFINESFNNAIVKGYNTHPAYVRNFEILNNYAQ